MNELYQDEDLEIRHLPSLHYALFTLLVILPRDMASKVGGLC